VRQCTPLSLEVRAKYSMPAKTLSVYKNHTSVVSSVFTLCSFYRIQPNCANSGSLLVLQYFERSGYLTRIFYLVKP